MPVNALGERAAKDGPKALGGGLREGRRIKSQGA